MAFNTGVWLIHLPLTAHGMSGRVQELFSRVAYAPDRGARWLVVPLALAGAYTACLPSLTVTVPQEPGDRDSGEHRAFNREGLLRRALPGMILLLGYRNLGRSKPLGSLQQVVANSRFTSDAPSGADN